MGGTSVFRLRYPFLQDFADLAADIGAVIFGKFVDGGVAVGFVGNVGNALRIAADLFGGKGW